MICQISWIADAKDLSARDRTFIAASVVNALASDSGIGITDTNINRQTALVKGQQVRTEKSKQTKKELFTGMERLSSLGEGPF